jgi:isochorismate hydrolase
MIAREGRGTMKTASAASRDSAGDRDDGIVIGLIAHTYVEATIRLAVELGYEVTVVEYATASYSDEEMHTALDVNLPNYAGVIVTARELVDSLSSVEASGAGAQPDGAAGLYGRSPD